MCYNIQYQVYAHLYKSILLAIFTMIFSHFIHIFSGLQDNVTLFYLISPFKIMLQIFCLRKQIQNN